MKRILLLTVMILLWAANAFASWTVWAEKLIHDTQPMKTYDPASKPASISLKGAKGEWLAFWVIMRTSGETFGGTAATGFVPSVTTTLQSGSNTIADTKWTFYMVQYVTTTSDTYTRQVVVCGDGDQGRPGGQFVGDWPDACVPYIDRFYGQERNSTEMGWAKQVPAGATQPFLAEIYIPTSTVAGSYHGHINLHGHGASTGINNADIEVNLTVYNFAVPLSPTYGSDFAINDSGISTAFGSFRVGLDLITRSMVDHNLWVYGQQQYMGPTRNESDGHLNFTGNFQATDSSTYWGFDYWLKGTHPNDSDNPKPYYGFRPPIFNTRPENGHGWSTGAGWRVPTDDTNAKNQFDDWDTYINGLTLDYTDTNTGQSRSTFFIAKVQDEVAPPEGCSTFISDAMDSIMLGGTTDRHHIWVGQTMSGPGTTPSDCSTLNNKSYHQLWIDQDQYGLWVPYWADGYVGRAPISEFATRIGTYGDKVMSYNAETANDYMTVNGYCNNDLKCVSPSLFTDPILGGREAAALPLEMWIWGLPGMHYWSIDGGFNDTSWSDLDTAFGCHNGDGMLFYSGFPDGTGSHDIGGSNTIPVESIRLKLMRWGMNVLEYAEKLKAAGMTSTANTEIAKMVQLLEAGDIWGTAAAWEAAKDAMGEVLSASAILAQGSEISGSTIK